MKALYLLALLGLVLAPRAVAHVTAKPGKVPADSVARIVLLVEGEETVPAIKVAVQLPRGLREITFQPKAAWKRTLNGRVVTWSGGTIDHEEFGSFALRARMPNAPGTQLVFPTVETYANGKVARWIGAESSDTPAPRLVLTRAKAPKPPPPPPVTTTVTSSRDEGGGGLAIWLVAAAIVIGLVALGLMLFRRRRA